MVTLDSVPWAEPILRSLPWGGHAVVAYLLLAQSAALVGAIAWVVWRFTATRRWPYTEGVFTDGWISPDEVRVVQYTYSVSGQNRVGWSSLSIPSSVERKSAGQLLVSDCLDSMKVRVYFDPKNPATSTLGVGITGLLGNVVFVIVFVVLWSATLGWMAVLNLSGNTETLQRVNIKKATEQGAIALLGTLVLLTVLITAGIRRGFSYSDE
jgi:hypothetical protein